MYWVSFPGIGIDRLFLNDYALEVFGLKIKWYGIIVALAIVIASLFAFFLLEKFGIKKEDFFGVLNGALIFGIVGARLYYFIFNIKSFNGNFLEVFNLRSGGLAIYGGIIFAVTFGIIYCGLKKIVVLPILDVSAICLLIGQSIGRWGNFVNVEAYGIKTNLPWGMISDRIPKNMWPVHPTFLYESLWCLLGFIIFNFLIKYRKFDGQMFLMYMVWYGFERFFVEGIRTDSLWLFKNFLRVSQLLSLIIFFVGLVSLIYLLKFYIKKNKDKNLLYVKTKNKK